MTPNVWIGTSGWRYANWRGRFYPPDVPQRLELSYLAEKMDSVEINGSFYSLQRPASYVRWAEQTPDDFVFAVKGGRYITHLKKLRGIDAALANFFASGLLALDAKLGPLLWQLPPTLGFDEPLLAEFLSSLPRSTAEAAALALHHDTRLDDRAWTTTAQDRPIRHALEVRHDSYRDPRFEALLRDQDIALVVSDGASHWLQLDATTADFVYVRLHGASELYTSGYDEPALRRWAGRVEQWTSASHDVYVYFDNDAKVRAPVDAMALRHLIGNS
jgi:uncharacterized protein YecE (DUF72 family)